MSRVSEAEEFIKNAEKVMPQHIELALLCDTELRIYKLLAEIADVIDITSDPNKDTVRVVRCKDCKHYWKNSNDFNDSTVCLASPKDEAFCSEGERKETEE